MEVTVAIPTHNRRETAVLAARSALAQSHAPTEVVILCDASDDGTAEAMRALGDPRVVVLELPKGPGYAYGHRNVALERASDDGFVAWLADDDLWLPRHLEHLADVARLTGADLLQAPAALVHPDDRLEAMQMDWSVPAYRNRLLALSTWTPMGAVLVRAGRARAAGGWDAGLPRGGDLDLWRRAVRSGARTASGLWPTVLHFRATGRIQTWPERVAQNERWFARLADPLLPYELSRLRAEAEAAREAAAAERIALLEGHRDWADDALERVTAELERLRAEHGLR